MPSIMNDIRIMAVLMAVGFGLSGCLGGDPDLSRRLLYEAPHDYYYGKANPTDNDPDFTYGWDIDGP